MRKTAGGVFNVCDEEMDVKEGRGGCIKNTVCTVLLLPITSKARLVVIAYADDADATRRRAAASRRRRRRLQRGAAGPSAGAHRRH